MKHKFKFHIGMRTIKTAAAVTLSILVVDALGATASKVIFAMLGAMAAVQTTFKASLESCLTQLVGLLFGALAGVLLLVLPISPLLAAGIGIILVITAYNSFGIRYSPALSCIVVVTLCMTPDIQPITYALGRIWDTAIGLVVGMAINTLIFPYDNSRQIRATAASLDREIIVFLEEAFDGDDIMPDPDAMAKKIGALASQLNIFADQRLLLHLRRQREQLERFRLCERKALELLARMTVLSQVESLGRLNDANRERLASCGADIRDSRVLVDAQERDVITNYHVTQILNIRQELLDAMEDQL